MTVKEFLLLCNIDIEDNKNFSGNDLEGSNSLLNENTIDFNINIENLSNNQMIFLGNYFKNEQKDLFTEADYLDFFLSKKNEIIQKG